MSYETHVRATNLKTMNSDLACLVAATHEENFAWALGCCRRDRREAEEVLQAVYLKVLDGRARFEGRSSLKTWLFAVIRRTAAQHRRLGWLRGVRFLPLTASPDAAAGAPGADETVEVSERRGQLERALGRLSARQREVLLLVFYHEYTVEEAAGVMGVGVGSARTHYERGKARLRLLLGEAS
jgi:RNA polymerase sigma-70 factor (ECF subfamily)